MTSEVQLIGISGGSGSGKTTFLNALKTEFQSESVCFIALDDYYIPRDEQLTDEHGVKNFDLPTSIDASSALADLNNLLKGESVERSKYTFNNNLAEKEIVKLNPSKVYIVEGLFLYHYKKLADLMDLKLYIDTSDELKLIRRIKRDQIERNYPIEDVLYRYEHHVMPSYRKYIESYKPTADLIINNNENFEKGLSVIKTYIKGLLI